MPQESIFLYDVTRLIARRCMPFPTGIDRIDVKLAVAVFDNFSKVSSPIIAINGQYRVLGGRERVIVIDFLKALEAFWFKQENIPDATLRQVNRLGIAPFTKSPSKRKRKPDPLVKRARNRVCAIFEAALQNTLFWSHQLTRREEVVDFKNICYINVSHQGLLRSCNVLKRLSDNSKLTVVCYLHDLMPLEIPEYTRRDQLESLRSFFDETTKYSTQYVVNSRSTFQSLKAFLDAKGIMRSFPQVKVIYPGIRRLETGKDVDLNNETIDAPSAERVEFTVLGTIEPRKNHLLLLQIWRELADSGFEPMPHLNFIGKRGWMYDSVAAFLDNCDVIRPYIHEHSGLADNEVANIIRRSKALLYPTFAEGFGFPLVEALALNCPIVASDIGIFRELILDGANLIHPLDGKAWMEEVKRVSLGGKLSVSTLIHELPTWDEHKAEFCRLLEDVTDVEMDSSC